MIPITGTKAGRTKELVIVSLGNPDTAAERFWEQLQFVLANRLSYLTFDDDSLATVEYRKFKSFNSLNKYISIKTILPVFARLGKCS